MTLAMWVQDCEFQGFVPAAEGLIRAADTLTLLSAGP